MYLVINSTSAVHTLTRHFDNLIRSAEINPHEAPGLCRKPCRHADFGPSLGQFH